MTVTGPPLRSDPEDIDTEPANEYIAASEASNGASPALVERLKTIRTRACDLHDRRGQTALSVETKRKSPAPLPAILPVRASSTCSDGFRDSSIIGTCLWAGRRKDHLRVVSSKIVRIVFQRRRGRQRYTRQEDKSQTVA